MRKVLFATAALLPGFIATGFAQSPANPSQGQYAGPYGSGPATNNNNNAWGTANTPSGSAAAGPLTAIYAPNVIKVPDPGTIVIRLNGRVEVDMTANYTSVDTGRNAAGVPNGYKVNPLGISSYMRIYPAFDGMAANGLRYGGAIELRENFGAADRTFTNTTAGSTANGPSANSSGQTVFVRRAFTYLAADHVGIVRFGQADGVLGLFDNCIFTSQCWDAGVTGINGGALQATSPAGIGGIPFYWISQSGADYAGNKIVYLSPQVFGFDFGVQYAPNEGNSFQNEGLSVGCNQAGPTCINVSSGNDSTRWINQVGVGLRWQQTFGAVDTKVYGFYETAGKENLTTTAYTVPTPTGSVSTLRYDNLSFYKAGAAITAYNVTVAADYIGGAINGSLQMRPTGGVAENAVLTGITYANGPITLGAEVGLIDSQGDARLTGLSQRHEYEFAGGGSYKVAPGLQLVGEYMYIHRHQGAYDFNQGAPGLNGATRDAQGQGFLFATVLTW